MSWDTLIEEFDHEGIKCEIHSEMYPENPYKQFDQASVILSDVRGYDIGEKYDFSRFKSTRHAARYLTMFDGYALAIPFDFQDYGSSGARIHLEEPNDNSSDYPSIDGFLVLTQRKYEEEFGNYGIPIHSSPEFETSAETTIRAEFKEFKAYIEGEVMGWRIAPGSSEEESCWGYYGDIEYVRNEAKAAAKYLAEERKRQRSFPWMGFLNPGMVSGRGV